MSPPEFKYFLSTSPPEFEYFLSTSPPEFKNIIFFYKGPLPNLNFIFHKRPLPNLKFISLPNLDIFYRRPLPNLNIFYKCPLPNLNFLYFLSTSPPEFKINFFSINVPSRI